MKKIIPNSIKLLRIRIIWFFKNYSKINYNSDLFSNELHGPVTYRTDGLITSNNCDFINEKDFSSAYQKAKDTNPWPGFTLQWRTYIVCWFANHVKNLEGDFVECGVNTGAYSRAVIDYIDFANTKKAFYLFDTFSGLEENLVSESEKKIGIKDYFGTYKDVYQQVLDTFSQFNVKVIKGAVPYTLPECTADKICYLSIDMNCVEPEIAAANYFWDKLVCGGVILLDDYGFPMHIHQKHAFDEFAKEKGVKILSLPTGQGIIIKK